MNMNSLGQLTTNIRLFGHTVRVASVVALAVFLCGCKTTTQEDQQASLAQAAVAATQASEPRVLLNPAEKLLLREGDTLRITFPGAPNLNALQAVRRDGKITLPLVGEVQAAGLAPVDLEKRLLELYGPQLQTKEISVALEASAFQIYVVGAVLRPGKIVSDRPISALEAIMEAGGFDQTRANMKKVRVIRYVAGSPEYHTLNLRNILAGQGSAAFALRPADIIFVPERFTWF